MLKDKILQVYTRMILLWVLYFSIGTSLLGLGWLCRIPAMGTAVGFVGVVSIVASSYLTRYLQSKFFQRGTLLWKMPLLFWLHVILFAQFGIVALVVKIFA